MKETNILEFKSKISDTFLKTVSAYANFHTGNIEFGRNDDGTIKGIENIDQTRLDIEHKINDNIHPKPDYEIRVDQKNKIIILTVKKGRFTPYYYKNKAYRRSDTSTVEVDTIELNRLILEGEHRHYEDLPVKDNNLTFEYLEKILIDKIGIKKLTDDMLKTLDFYTEEASFNNAAALVADINDFPGIDVARFGSTISEILERVVFENHSILKQYEEIIEVFRRYYQYEEIKEFERNVIAKIPEEAFREAIANSLVHRTWDIKSNIKVSMYDDKIEIVSPGGLPSGLSRDEYLNGNISNLRNPIIAHLFYRLKYIEMFGTGIRRIMECYQKSLVKPEFDIYDNSIKITLPVISDKYEVTPDAARVLEMMNSGLQLSNADISARTGWKRDKTIRIINQLKNLGYIKVVGSGRGTRYARV